MWLIWMGDRLILRPRIGMRGYPEGAWTTQSIGLRQALYADLGAPPTSTDLVPFTCPLALIWISE
jgi:hypothetical protein